MHSEFDYESIFFDLGIKAEFLLDGAINSVLKSSYYPIAFSIS
jgi:hypothetical protein